LEEILQDIRRQPGKEACGLLGGVGGQVERVYPITNVAANPAVGFYMDPMEQLTAFMDMDEQGWVPLAAYHSHPPGGPVVPSASDIALALDPALVSVIIVIDGEGNLSSIRAFRIDGDQIWETPLEIIDWCG
jgi:proteasome lid subunit RPN8/RPN11